MMVTGAEQQEPQIAKPRLRVYDFKRPDKFSKDHLRGVQMLFDNLCRFVTSYFSGFFRMTVHSNVESVDPVSYTHLDVYKRQVQRCVWVEDTPDPHGRNWKQHS